MPRNHWIQPRFSSKKLNEGEWLWLISLTLFYKVEIPPATVPGNYLTRDGLVELVVNHRNEGCVILFHVCRPGEVKPFSFYLEPVDGKYGIVIRTEDETFVPETPSLGDFSGPSVPETPSLEGFEEPAFLEDADTTALLGGKKKRRRGLHFLRKRRVTSPLRRFRALDVPE